MAEFGIELPEFESDTRQPGDYFRLIHPLIETRQGWAVTEAAYLVTFSYSKLAMWRDLEGIKKGGTEHPIVRTLAGEASVLPASEQTASPMALADMDKLDAGRLDDVLEIRDHHTVLPADYSQLIAITGAKSGTHLVIHGPRGTGKSQTIANIIADTMAAGQSILFVSERTAALGDPEEQRAAPGMGTGGAAVQLVPNTSLSNEMLSTTGLTTNLSMS